MEIKDLLLTWDEYNQKEFATPYIFTLEKGGQKLIYFGANHSFDPKHEQFEKIRSLWNSFLNETVEGKRLMVIESHISNIVTDEQEAIIKTGEVGFAALLAHSAQCPYMCFEPRVKDVFETLLKSYTKDELIYHDIIQSAFQWNNLTKKPDFKEYIEHYLKWDAKELGWTDFDFSYKNIERIHQEMFGKALDKNDRKLFYDIIDPSQKNGIINEVSREVDLVRDSRVVETIKSEWEKNNSIFVVYGSGHAVIQEPALRKLLN